MSPKFAEDLALASALGHGEFSMDIKHSDYLDRDKFWFCCSCGYRSTVRWSAADAMQVAQWHIQKVAEEHRKKLATNGVSRSPKAGAAR